MFLEEATLATIEFFEFLLPLAIILVLSKLLSIGAKRIGLPQVIGLLLTGVIIGLFNMIPGVEIVNEGSAAGIKFVAEIGVILIMFSAGLETDLKQIKATGVAAAVITVLGVVVPMALGFLVAMILPNEADSTKTIFRNLFYGVILTATSVSVTVATLKELGKLNSKIGTAIISAAILDDIIGVIVLSVIVALDSAMAGGGAANEGGYLLGNIIRACGGNTSSIGMQIFLVITNTVLFFGFAIAFGLLLRLVFRKLSSKYDHHRRIPIFAMAAAFFYAYAAEKWFGIADITGAFFAGLILSGDRDANYIERRTDITSYLIFTPVFFAKVGITSMGSFGNMFKDPSFLLFGFLFVFAGIAGKLLGCGAGAKVTKHDWKDSLRCGVGMMCRAEVCLICAQKGIDKGIIDDRITPFILILILVTSFTTPLILKATYKKETYDEFEGEPATPNYQGPSMDQ